MYIEDKLVITGVICWRAKNVLTTNLTCSAACILPFRMEVQEDNADQLQPVAALESYNRPRPDWTSRGRDGLL